MGSAEECMRLNVEQQRQREEEEEMVNNWLTVHDDHPGDDDSDDSSSSSSDDNEDYSDSSSSWDDFDDDCVIDVSSDESDDEPNTDHHAAAVVQEPPAYIVLNETGISTCQMDNMGTVSSSLGVTIPEAAVILLNYNWNVRAVLDRWSRDGPELLREVGLFPSPVVEPSHAKDEVNCRICRVTFLAEELVSASCGHLFCHNCWSGYIERSVEDGMECLKLHCPFPSCRAAITPEMISNLATDLDNTRFNHFLRLSYVEYNSKVKWCPANCRNAVLLINENSMYNITCNCLYSFCWACREEAHQPASCVNVHNWQLQCSFQADDWIPNNRKCPRCNRSTHISRRAGLTECYVCNIQFCCICLSRWTPTGHQEGGGFRHICSEENLNSAEIIQYIDESQMQEARVAIAKHNKCRAQWMSFYLEQQLAMTEIQKLYSDQLLEKVAAIYRLPPGGVRFIRILFQEIVECKRVLKWTNVEDQYLAPSDVQRSYHLLYLQRQVKLMADRLCECANHMKIFFILDEPSEQFEEFSKHVCLEISVAHSFVRNMIWGYKMAPTDMDSLRAIMRVPPPNSTMTNNMIRRVVNEEGLWRCVHCRFPNNASTFVCVMCFH